MKRFIPLTVMCSMLLSTAAGWCDESNVRGMYVEQEHNQAVHKNTGMVYYLELKRGDQPVRRCTNKTAFHNGDKIRIHLKSNVEGYAYIVQLQGSEGDKEVLFPGEDLGSNKVHAGKWVTLPRGSEGNKAWMKFDKHPGVEVIRMLVSRNKINPDDSNGTSAVSIASGDDGDRVSSDVVVSVAVSKGDHYGSGTRNLTVEQDAPADTVGETTVVGKPNKVLAVDFALNHTAPRDED